MTNLFDEAEITQLNGSLSLDEYILRFNVSMKEAMAVNVVQRRCNLLDYMSDLLVREWIIVELAHLHHPVQVHIKQLKHHVESIIMPNHLQASHNVLVL